MSQIPRHENPTCSLVTGAAGFIGSHVVDELINNGQEVIAIDDLSGGFLSNVNPRATFLQGSVTDSDFIEDVFKRYRFDYVYHLAAYAAEGLSNFIRCFNYTNNVVGSMTLINGAVRQGCKCFVFTSSIAVYGSGQTPMTEAMPPHPEDPYGIAKYAVELDLAAAKSMFGLNYIVFRPHNVYGERQNIGDRYRNVVGIFMNQILRGLPCTIFGDGTQRRAFTHVSDVAPLIASSVANERAYGEVFNIGSDVPYCLNDLVELVQSAMGIQAEVRYLDRREEVLHAFSDHSKCAQVFDYRAKVELPDGLRRMAEWVKSVGARQTTTFGHIEVEKNLPAAWRTTCSEAIR